MSSGRFFGFVIGGALPVAIAADWLTSAWDQNAGSRLATPAHSAVEDAAAAWLLDLLGLPRAAAVGFATGATMANTTCLAAARQRVLRDAGWDLDRDGLFGAPRVHVLVGEERHETIDLGLRYLGLGRPRAVAVDDQGRMRPDALRAALGELSGPAIVVLQAGNIHSGAFDPFEACIPLAREHGAWVHVDGAFGLWAAAAPARRHLTAGMEAADSWGTDAHKTLNVPYDCGIAVVADPAEVRAAVGMHAEYLPLKGEQLEPYEKVPELSRRARAFPVWAVLRALGRSGVADLVERLCVRASAMAEGLAEIPGAEVLNEVPYTQVCVAFGSDERTERVLTALFADGTTWMTGSRWRGRAIMRVSVSNWRTTEDDVARSLEAVRRVALAAH
jgi:glutamate/tyrosine decarboxylase-like PLP-dependent enzyme